MVIWLTGLSGAGKSTLAAAVASSLEGTGLRTETLDADELRATINRDLGFSRHDRDENVRRIARIAEVLASHGILTVVAAISPYRETRLELRGLITNYVEVFVDAPLQVCEERDPKGLYRKARAGIISGFTGISDPYEAPANPDVHCRTDQETVAESTRKIIDYISAKREVVRRSNELPTG
jgi:adenylylsulfate kinase